MAVKTYRLGAGQDGNFGALFEADQTAATRTDGWTSAKLAAANMSEFDAGTKQVSGSFTTGAKPASFLTGATANALKTPAALTGVFATGNWQFTFALRCSVASAQRGRMRMRVFKSVNADGSGATELTGSTQIGTTVTAALSTTADQTSVVTWVPGTTITLSNEFLFFVLAWEITTAGGSNTADVLMRAGQVANGTRLLTPDFAAIVVHYGATSLPVTFSKAVAGTKKTFGQTATPVTFGAATAGDIVGVVAHVRDYAPTEDNDADTSLSVTTTHAFEVGDLMVVGYTSEDSDPTSLTGIGTNTAVKSSQQLPGGVTIWGGAFSVIVTEEIPASTAITLNWGVASRPKNMIVRHFRSDSTIELSDTATNTGTGTTMTPGAADLTDEEDGLSVVVFATDNPITFTEDAAWTGEVNFGGGFGGAQGTEYGTSVYRALTASGSFNPSSTRQAGTIWWAGVHLVFRAVAAVVVPGEFADTSGFDYWAGGEPLAALSGATATAGLDYFAVDEAAPGIIGEAQAPPVTHYGSSSFSITFGETTAGQRKAFGATAFSVTFGKEVAAQRKTFGQIARPFTFAAVTAAQRKTFGVVARPITFGEITAASRKTFGAVALPITFSKAVSGQRKAFGVVALPLVFTKAVVGQRKTFGATATPFVFGEVTAGRKQTFGQTTLPVTFLAVTSGIATTGAVTHFGVVSAPFTFGEITQGRRIALGRIAVSLVFGEITQARRKTFAQIALPVSFLEVTQARRRTFSQISAPFAFSGLTAARRRTFGALVMPITLSEAVQGRKQTFGAVARPFTFTIATAGIGFTGAQTYFGSSALILTFGELTQGRKKTFGIVARPITFGEVTQGRRKTFSTMATVFNFNRAVQGRKQTFGIVARPITVAFVTEGIGFTGTQTYFGATAMPITFGEITQGRKKTFAQIVAPFVFGKATAGRRVALGQIAATYVFSRQVAGRKKTFGQIATVYVFTETIQARKGTFGSLEFPIFVSFDFSATIGEREYITGLLSAMMAEPELVATEIPEGWLVATTPEVKLLGASETAEIPKLVSVNEGNGQARIRKGRL